MIAAMPGEVSFENVRAALRDGAEDAWLVYLDHTLMALLVPADTGWYLQCSLGRSEQEGLIFPNLAAAEIWARARVDAAV